MQAAPTRAREASDVVRKKRSSMFEVLGCSDYASRQPADLPQIDKIERAGNGWKIPSMRVASPA